MGCVQRIHFLANCCAKQSAQNGFSSREVNFSPTSILLHPVHVKHSRCHGVPLYVIPPLLITYAAGNNSALKVGRYIENTVIVADIDNIGFDIVSALNISVFRSTSLRSQVKFLQFIDILSYFSRLFNVNLETIISLKLIISFGNVIPVYIYQCETEDKE